MGRGCCDVERTRKSRNCERSVLITENVYRRDSWIEAAQKQRAMTPKSSAPLAKKSIGSPASSSDATPFGTWRERNASFFALPCLRRLSKLNTALMGIDMRWIAIGVAPCVVAGFLLLTAQPSAAISADLAKKCRQLMIKAHPPHPFSKSHSAEMERTYFKKCIANGGNMPDLSDERHSPDNPSMPASSAPRQH